MTRKSLALYYYSLPQAPTADLGPHYKARAQDGARVRLQTAAGRARDVFVNDLLPPALVRWVRQRKR